MNLIERAEISMPFHRNTPLRWIGTSGIHTSVWFECDWLDKILVLYKWMGFTDMFYSALISCKSISTNFTFYRALSSFFLFLRHEFIDGYICIIILSILCFHLKVLSYVFKALVKILPLIRKNLIVQNKKFFTFAVTKPLMAHVLQADFCCWISEISPFLWFNKNFHRKCKSTFYYFFHARHQTARH